MTDGMRTVRRANLKRLMQPRSIAFIGGRHLERCIASCRDSDFAGQIMAVSPNYESIAGIRCAPSIESLGAVPDAAFVALSRDRSIEAVTSLAAIGTPGAVCHAAGFGELGGEYSVAQEQLARAAGEMAVIGPNCMGVINAFDGVSMWGEYNPVPRLGDSGIAVISQSGAFLYGIASVEQAFPMGYGISVGNQAVIDSADLIDCVLDDQRVRVLGLYIEGLTDGPVLADAFCKALAQEVPVVLLRAGGTPAAAQRAMSHTGNLAVPNDFWAALIDRYTLIEVTSPKQLVETTKLLSVAGAPRGKRMFFVTNSGAAATLLTEQAPQHGLSIPPVSDETSAKILPTLPDAITISNPFDFNLPWRSNTQVSMDNAGSMAACLRTISADQTDALIFMLDIPRRGSGSDTPWLPTIDALVELNAQVEFPVIASGLFPEGLEPHLREQLLAGGVTPLCGFSDTLEALAQTVKYRERRNESSKLPEPLLRSSVPSGKPLAVDENDGKRRLAEYGLPVPAGLVCSPEEAGLVGAKLGFPVALKVSSTTLLHKSKLGGVRLGLHNEQQVEEAVRRMRADLRQNASGYELKEVLIETMVTDSVAELLIGVKRHPQLGPALMIGLGGVQVERLAAYGLVLLPADEREISAVLDHLDLATAPTARTSVLDAIRAVEKFTIEHADSLLELDVNPVLLRGNGSVVAADALLIMTA